MDFQQLNTFVTLAQYENMSASAHVLNTSQPQVSKLLASLEAELGVKLFDRQGRGIRLNQHGEIFLKYARQTLEDMRAGQRAMKNLGKMPLGTVTICATAFAPILDSCVLSFGEKNPHVSFRYVRSTATTVLDWRRVDIMLSPISYGVYNYQVHFPVFRKLFSENYYIVCSPRLAPAPERVSTEDYHRFLKLPFILMGKSDNYATSSDHQILKRMCQSLGETDPEIRFEVNEFAFKMMLVEEGAGMSVLPESCLAAARKIVPELQVVPIGEYAPRREVIIARKKQENMTPIAMDFWDYMLKHFSLERE